MAEKNTVEIIIKAAVDKAAADIKKFTDSTKAGFEGAAKAIAQSSTAAATAVASAFGQLGIRAVAQMAEQSASAVAAAFEQLKIRTVAQVTEEKDKVTAAYQAIAQSGTASAADISRAQQAMTTRVKELTKESQAGFADTAQASESMGTRMKAAWAGAKAAWVEVAALLYTVKKAYDFAFDAAMFREREQAFANMAASMGTDAKTLLGDLQRLSHGTISDMQLMEKAGAALNMGIPAEKIKGLLEIAEAAARITGQTVEQAFSDLALGVARQSDRMLVSLGINLNLVKVNDDYARSLNKTSEELTDTERMQAFLNATLQAGEDIIKRVGDETDSAAVKMQRWQAHMENMKITAGKAILSVGVVIESAWAGVMTVVSKAVGFVAGLWAKMISLGSSLPFVGDQFKKVGEAVKGFADNANKLGDKGWEHLKDNWSAIGGMWEDVKAGSGITARKQIADAGLTAAAEKKALEERLKQYIGFYGEVDTQQKAALESYKKGLEDIREIEDSRFAAGRKAADLILDAQGKTREGVEAYRYQIEGLENIEQRANDSTGKRRVELLDQYMQKAAEIAKQFKEGAGYASGEAIIEKMTSAIQYAAIEQDAAYQQMEDAARAKTEADRIWAEELTQTLAQVTTQIKAMQTAAKEQIQVALEITDAQGKIRLIQAELAAIKDKTVYVNVIYSSGGAGGGGGGMPLVAGEEAAAPSGETGGASGSWSAGAEGSFQAGTDYVPRTGIYLVHKGERVVPEPQAVKEKETLKVFERVKEFFSSHTENIMSVIRAAAPRAEASYQTGTDYVPRTGLPAPKSRQAGMYQLHQGERVLTRSETKQQSVTINLTGGIHISAESRESAADVARKLDAEIANGIKYGRSRILQELKAAGMTA